MEGSVDAIRLLVCESRFVGARLIGLNEDVDGTLNGVEVNDCSATGCLSLEIAEDPRVGVMTGALGCSANVGFTKSLN